MKVFFFLNHNNITHSSYYQIEKNPKYLKNNKMLDLFFQFMVQIKGINEN